MIKALLLTAALAFAQNGTVSISSGPPQEVAVTTLMFYDASSNLQYICRAPQQLNAYSWAVTPNGQGTLTNVVVLTNVGTVTTVGNYGLQVNAVVTIAGSTTAALNGTYVVASVPSSTTFTIATSGVSNGTYNNAAMSVTTNAPRSSAPQWSIQKLIYDTSNRLINVQWAANVQSGRYGTTTYVYTCDSRASYGYQ